MKKITFLLLLACCSSTLFGQVQQIKIVNFKIKNQLPARIENWENIDAAASLTAVKQSQVGLNQVKLVVQIKTNGLIVCGNSPATASLTKFSETKMYNTNDLISLVSGIESLKKGVYSFCARFYNVDNVPVSDELCRSFTISDDPVKGAFIPQKGISKKAGEDNVQKGEGSIMDSEPVIINPEIDQNCAACDLVKITIPTSTLISFYNNSTFTLTQAITIAATPLKLIKSIKAELTYFEFIPESDDCLACNKNSALYGNINTGTIAGVTGTGGISHSMLFTFLPPKLPGSFPASINMTLPPTVNCCTGVLRFCIRYVVAFDDCTVCSKTVCYEKKKVTDPVIIDNPIPVNNQN